MAVVSEEFIDIIYFDEINSFTWMPENIRNKDEHDELSEEDLESIKAAYTIQLRKTNFARFILNFLPALFTGPIFHLLYWIIKAIAVAVTASKHEFSWDWSREFQNIDISVSQLEKVKAFIDNPPQQVSQDSEEIIEDSEKTPRKNMTFKKAAVRTVSFWYNEANPKAIRLSHVITGLFLGRIPHKTPQIIIDFVNDVNPTRPLGLVVSVVEKDELRGDGFLGAKMVKPTEWTQAGIEHHLISMVDFTHTVDIAESIQTIKKIHDCIESGKAVYIHCKAGRSRSAMFCIIYMCCFLINPITKKNYTKEEALKLLKDARSNVDVGRKKMEMAQDIIDEFQDNFNRQEMLSSKDKDRIDVILGSKKIKDKILLLPAVDALRLYKINTNKEKLVKKSSERGKRVDKILQLIQKPSSEEWFFTLLESKGIFQKFLTLGPSDDDEKNLRKQLINNLREQVVDYIKEAIKYTYEAKKEVDCTEESSSTMSCA